MIMNPEPSKEIKKINLDSNEKQKIVLEVEDASDKDETSEDDIDKEAENASPFLSLFLLLYDHMPIFMYTHSIVSTSLEDHQGRVLVLNRRYTQLAQVQIGEKGKGRERNQVTI